MARLQTWLATVMVFLVVGIANADSNSTSISEWKMLGRTLDNRRYYPAKVNMTNFGFLWRTNQSKRVSSGQIIHNGIIYLGGVNSMSYAFNATDGAEIWDYPTGDMKATPSIDNEIVYLASSDHKIYALNATNGSLIWLYTTGGLADSSPCIVDGILYVGPSMGKKALALNATDGTHIWNYTFVGDGSIRSSPAISEGKFYVGGEGVVVSLNATDGSHIWNYSMGGSQPSTPSLYRDMLYIVQNNNVYALNSTDGSYIWSYSIDASSFGFAVADDKVYFGNSDVVLSLILLCHLRTWYSTAISHRASMTCRWISCID